MIGLTAPTGKVGRHLADLLADAGIRARLLARNPAEHADTRHAVVAADLDDPSTLPAALTGVDDLFLLSPGPDTPAQDAAVLSAAVDVGVRHVVLLSSLGVEAGGIGGGTAHAPGERILAASSLAATVLRPSEFMTNTLAWLPEIRARGTISVPTGHGRVAAVAPHDIAAVAFYALTRAETADQTYRLTGPAALTTQDIAAVLSTVLGRPIKHVDVSVEEFRAGAVRAGMPGPVADILAEYYPALARGALNIVTDTVLSITGRPATSYLDWAIRAFADR